MYSKIKKLCDERGIGISTVEKACGIGNATIRGWVNSSPTVENLKKVADYFGVSIDYFLEDNKEAIQ